MAKITKTILFYYVLFLASIRSEVITDPGTAIIQCTGGEDCTIICNQARTCQNSQINCPPGYQCIFTCGTGKKACAQSTINAADSTRLEINDCASGNKGTCSGMTVYVPPNSAGTPRTFLNVGNNFNGNLAPMHFYAIYGWNDIDSTGYGGTYFSHDGTMHCTDDYSVSCAFNTNSWSCLGSGDTTCDNPPTPQPTTVTNDPTSSTLNPTATPTTATNDPTTSTSNPTVSTANPTTSTPTASPSSAAPTLSPITTSPTTSLPTFNPVTTAPTTSPITSNPNVTPSVSPTANVPTSSPITSTPSVSPITSNPSVPIPTASPLTSNPTIEPTANPSIQPSDSPVTEAPTVLVPTTSPIIIITNTDSEFAEGAGSNTKPSGLSGGAIAGIVCGVLAFIILIIVGAYFATRCHATLTAKKMEEHFGVQSFKDVTTATKDTGEQEDADGYLEKMENPIHLGSKRKLNASPHSPDDHVPPPPTSPHPEHVQQTDAYDPRLRALSQPVMQAQDANRARSNTQPAVVNAARRQMYERWSNMFRGGQIGGTQTYFTNPGGVYGAAGTLSAECQLVSPQRVKSHAFPADIDRNFVVGSPVAVQHVQSPHAQSPMQQQLHHGMQQHPMQYPVHQHPQHPHQQPVHQHHESHDSHDDETNEESHDISDDSDSHHTFTKFDTKQTVFQTIPRMHTEWLEHDIAMHHDPEHPQMQMQSGASLDHGDEWSHDDSHHTYTRFDTQQSVFQSIPRMDTELLKHDIDLHHAEKGGLQPLQVIHDGGEQKQAHLQIPVQSHDHHEVQQQEVVVRPPPPAYTDNATALQQQFGVHIMHNINADENKEHDRLDTVMSDMTDITDVNLEYKRNISYKD